MSTGYPLKTSKTRAYRNLGIEIKDKDLLIESFERDFHLDRELERAHSLARTSYSHPSLNNGSNSCACGRNETLKQHTTQETRQSGETWSPRDLASSPLAPAAQNFGQLSPPLLQQIPESTARTPPPCNPLLANLPQMPHARTGLCHKMF